MPYIIQLCFTWPTVFWVALAISTDALCMSLTTAKGQFETLICQERIWRSHWCLASVLPRRWAAVFVNSSAAVGRDWGKTGGVGGGMGRLQWHMLRFKLSLDSCSSGGPAGALNGIHLEPHWGRLVGHQKQKPRLSRFTWFKTNE